MRTRHPVVCEVRRNTIDEQRNCLIVTLGKTGTGKSYIDMDFAHHANKRFSISRDTVWRADSFIERTYYQPTRPNDQIFFDDVATNEGMARREWYSITNKAMVYILTTQRVKRLGVWFNTVSMDLLDSNTQKFVDILIRTKRVNREQKKIIFKAYKTRWNDDVKKLYKEFFLDDKGRKIKKFKRRFGHIPQAMMDEYEKKAGDFKQQLGRELKKEMDYLKTRETDKFNKASEDKGVMDTIYSDVIKRGISSPYMVKRAGKWKLNDKMIMGELNVGTTAAKRASAALYVKLFKESFFEEING